MHKYNKDTVHNREKNNKSIESWHNNDRTLKMLSRVFSQTWHLFLVILKSPQRPNLKPHFQCVDIRMFCNHPDIVPQSILSHISGTGP
jgi:hypothetical protein